MKNKEAEKVIKRILEENRGYTIRIIGDKENKDSGFYIIMTTQHTFSNEKDVFHSINKKTLALLDEAIIKYEVMK